MNKKAFAKRLRINITPVLIAIALLIIFLGSTYWILNRIAVRMVSDYTEEFMKHDMETIHNFVRDRYELIQSVANEFRNREIDDVEEMMTELHNKSYVLELDHCFFFDDKGNVYSDTKEIFNAENNPFKDVMDWDGRENFVTRFDDENDIWGKEEYMFYGHSFADAPIRIDKGDKQITLVGIIAINDISKIRSRFQITCFGGRGSVSVIENGGNYVITGKGVAYSGDEKNFFRVLNNYEIKNTSAPAIQKKINAGEDVSFWCVDKDGVEKLVSVYEIENSEWKFIVSLDQSIFKDQTKVFVAVTVFIIFVLLVAGAIGFLAAQRSKKKLQNMYVGVVDGVYNRMYYDDVLEGEFVFAFAITDMDSLKQINDTYGHAAGDQAIKKLAQSIKDCVGERAEVFRFGGDEFGIVYREPVDAAVFEDSLRHICEVVRKEALESYPGVTVTTSIGGYYGRGKTEELLLYADELLYKAKGSKNCCLTNMDR